MFSLEVDVEHYKLQFIPEVKYHHNIELLDKLVSGYLCICSFCFCFINLQHC